MRKQLSFIILIGIILVTGCQTVEPTIQAETPEVIESQPFSKEYPEGEPLLFREGEVSTDGVELSLVVHPNLQEIYFTRFDSGLLTIWASTQDSTGWSQPEVAVFSGSYNDISPFISADGQNLYFASMRPIEGQSTPSEVYHIWVMERDGEGWGEPEQLVLPGNSINGESHPSLTKEGTLYYMANYQDWGGDGLYRAELMDDEYQTPEKIDLFINSNQIVDVEPYISPDESFILFYSAGRPDNLTLDRLIGDIYIAFRTEDGHWNEPQNLGVPINSTYEEATPTLSPDGEYLFFASNKDSGTFPSIYWVDFASVQASLSTVEDRSGLPLTYSDLMNGFDFTGPVDEAALTPPEDLQKPAHIFEGTLELIDEANNGFYERLSGNFNQLFGFLPEFNFDFVQTDDGYIVPVERGLIIADHAYWNIHLEPGRVWQESGDHGYSRASIPFTLSLKGNNAVFNGTLTFLFNDTEVSKVWYQVTQEIAVNTRVELWGLLDAEYHPATIEDASQIRTAFEEELAARIPTKPIEELAVDYPGVDLSAFGSKITDEHMSWYGFVINGVNYVGGCETRYGTYPYCESMRASAYSTTKSAFAAVALMRLEQKYGPGIADLLIVDYVPECLDSPGDWSAVTFEDALDMATGNYFSADAMVDDNSASMATFFGSQPFDARLAAALTAPSREPAGTRWVYRTSDTFLLMTAMQRYLEDREGEQADIFEMVVDEVYEPLGLGPGFLSVVRTADDDWQGQAEGGYGLFWTPDDVAKVSIFLNVDGGQIDGVQILDPDMLAASLQQDSQNRGLIIADRQMYNNAFWASHYGADQGYDCEFWVTEMQGISGNVIAFFPNDTIYYYFSDNREFFWSDAVEQADFMASMCSNYAGKS